MKTGLSEQITDMNIEQEERKSRKGRRKWGAGSDLPLGDRKPETLTLLLRRNWIKIIQSTTDLQGKPHPKD